MYMGKFRYDDHHVVEEAKIVFTMEEVLPELNTVVQMTSKGNIWTSEKGRWVKGLMQGAFRVRHIWTEHADGLILNQVTIGSMLHLMCPVPMIYLVPVSPYTAVMMGVVQPQDNIVIECVSTEPHPPIHIELLGEYYTTSPKHN